MALHEVHHPDEIDAAHVVSSSRARAYCPWVWEAAAEAAGASLLANRSNA